MFTMLHPKSMVMAAKVMDEAIFHLLPFLRNYLI